MQVLGVFLMGFALIAASIEPAEAASASQAALRSAKRRGYTEAQTDCFVPIFVRYASKTRNGTWLAGRKGKSGDTYRHEVLTKCGVVR